MDSLLVSIHYQDPLWIAIAFGFGLLFKQINLPPLVGFLVAGFVLNVMGAQSDQFLNAVADLGVTLLLFMIGLKLNVGSLLRREIWGTTLLHMSTSVLVTALLLFAMGQIGILVFSGLDLTTALILGFALSFSSTVFAVKVLEDRGAMASRYGQVAIGVLIIQDIAAVIFLAVSAGKVPSPWAILLLGLIPARHLLGKVLERCGHTELLAVFGFVLALGGAALFETVGMKGDLGALIMGVLLSHHAKGKELAHELMSFKEVFLVCFFLTIGLTGLPTLESIGSSLILLVLIPFKTMLFFWLFSRFRIRARGSALGALVLGNYSEFGLIVAAIAISAQWLAPEWLTVIALTVSASFVLSAPLNVMADKFYEKYRETLLRWQSKHRLAGDESITLSGYEVLIFGLGRVGQAVYTEIAEQIGTKVIGVDLDEEEVKRQADAGRDVVRGDATNPEFWSRLETSFDTLDLIVLAMPFHAANMTAIVQLRGRGYQGRIVATAKFKDEEDHLKEAGADLVFNIYTEAGVGAARSLQSFLLKNETA